MKILNLSYPMDNRQAQDIIRLMGEGIEQVENMQLTGSVEQAQELCLGIDWQPSLIVMPGHWQSELAQAAMYVWVNMGEPPVFMLDDDAVVQIGG